MIISMQGNWNVRVSFKEAAFSQRFVISGATSGNGVKAGAVGTTVAVTGSQWSIAIQNNPGTGFQLSDTRITFPRRVGANYEFEIKSNDAGGAGGGDQDFNDLILTCSTPATINDFIIYGNVTRYSGRCIFNPCRRGPFVIETATGLLDALKNPKLRDALERLYPERIPIPEDPNPPDPIFKPIVLDLFNEASRPRTVNVFQRSKVTAGKKKNASASEFEAGNFELVKTVQHSAQESLIASFAHDYELATAIEGVFSRCDVDPAPNITLSFDEYDRTAAELAGGAYTGTGPRRLLGDAITDMNGNYIFRFSFDMSFPFLEDAADIAPGENVNVVPYPDAIVKILGLSPNSVLYESAPYYNIPNLKRIDLCLPKSKVQVSSACFNGNLIGSLGNVFIGGNQNTNASLSAPTLRRYGNSNYLEANGKISVGSPQAPFNVECAAWRGTIDLKGCMYDAAKTAAQNKIRTYTIRIRRYGTAGWTFVSENYKHPKYSNRNLPNYIGDDVGAAPTLLKVDGGPPVEVPAYTNLQREIFVDGIDWEFTNLDRLMQLHTPLYDKVSGVTTPGTFYVRVDGYDATGKPVAGATDMVALFIHNLRLDFQLVGPSFSDPSIVDSGCGLYRLTDAQLNTPMQVSFKANDPYGFVNAYDLTTGRCPAPMLALQVNAPNPPLADTLSGDTTLAHGDAAANTHNTCPGYTGTLGDFTTLGLVNADIQPASSEGGWIRAGESFTVLSVRLTASMRVTNGYNTGVSSLYQASRSIYMERLGA